ncbi:TPA: hypothetical protein QDB26_005344 [Burkholderia vietnamiensis]|nr:hypothetical protein [Burkholderia vietnamiensis]HDR9216554.1 hypothetical protein [Burkholderia vietnamiensis]
MAFVKQSKFAELCGVSRQAVLKWKSEGKLVMQGALIDVDASLARLGRVRKGGAPVTSSIDAGPANPFETLPIEVLPGETLEAAAERLSADVDIDNTTFDEARRIKEVYLALLNRLEYDKKSGQVVMVEDVTTAVGAEYAKVRTRLLAIPSSYAPQIHRCKTVSEVNDLLERVIIEALEELTADSANTQAFAARSGH